MHRHRLDLGSVVLGVFFLSFAGVFLASGLEGGPIMPPAIVTATVLGGLGIGGLVRVLTRGRRRDR